MTDMLANKQKPFVGPIKAIKLGIVLGLALFLGFFFVGEAKAEFFYENFETYSIGDLSGQGNWETPYGSHSCWVGAIETYSGTRSISVKENYGSCGAKKEIATTTKSFFSFKFYAETKETGNNILYFLGTNIIQMTNEGIWTGEGIILLPNSENWAIKRWHTIGVDIDTEKNWLRARFNSNNWSATSTSGTEPITEVSLLYSNAYRNEQDFFIDYLEGYPSYDDYTYYEMGLPELPELEECGEYGLTDRILCELKNFFYRLFVPSPEKITELRSTLDLIKTKFPYNYILEIKNFFVYLKDNINEDEEINFSVLGQAGVVNFDFFNSTTTLAGVVQSFLTIFKIFFKFLIVLVFGLWCFTFIKRIFR